MLEAADELLGEGRIGDALLQRLDASLDTHQVMDLVFVVGTYNMLAMAFETWRLTPEPDTVPLPRWPARPTARCLVRPDVDRSGFAGSPGPPAATVDAASAAVSIEARPASNRRGGSERSLARPNMRAIAPRPVSSDS